VCDIGPRVNIRGSLDAVEPKLPINFDIICGRRVILGREDVVLGKERGKKSGVQGRSMSAIQSDTVRSKNLDELAHKANNVLLSVFLYKRQESRPQELCGNRLAESFISP
jgi:hypothetical protein